MPHLKKSLLLPIVAKKRVREVTENSEEHESGLIYKRTSETVNNAAVLRVQEHQVEGKTLNNVARMVVDAANTFDFSVPSTSNSIPPINQYGLLSHVAKTATQRSRECRARKKASNINVTKVRLKNALPRTPKTPAERSRDYRARKKAARTSSGARSSYITETLNQNRMLGMDLNGASASDCNSKRNEEKTEESQISSEDIKFYIKKLPLINNIEKHKLELNHKEIKQEPCEDVNKYLENVEQVKVPEDNYLNLRTKNESKEDITNVVKIKEELDTELTFKDEENVTETCSIRDRLHFEIDFPNMEVTKELIQKTVITVKIEPEDDWQTEGSKGVNKTNDKTSSKSPENVSNKHSEENIDTQESVKIKDEIDTDIKEDNSYNHTLEDVNLYKDHVIKEEIVIGPEIIPNVLPSNSINVAQVVVNASFDFSVPSTSNSIPPINQYGKSHVAKTATERGREFRARKRASNVTQVGLKTAIPRIPKTPAERSRDYRARKRARTSNGAQSSSLKIAECVP